MSIFCKIFGHKPPRYAKKGWYSPGEEYGELVRAGRDGAGRDHGIVFGHCARCDEKFRICRVHVKGVN